MNSELAQLALIFMPGLIWANIDEKYGAGKPPDHVKFFVRVFLFGMSTYVALYGLYSLAALCLEDLEFGHYGWAKDITNPDLSAFIDEIFWSVPLSLFLSVLWLYAVRYKVLRKLLHFLNTTERLGDEDLWSTILNEYQLGDPIYFRDCAKDLIYLGWVDSFSQNEDNREMVLRDVREYKDVRLEDGSTQHLFNTPRLYVSCDKNSILINFPNLSESEGDHHDR